MAVCIRNRSINHKTGLTPIEVMTGRRPNFEKFELFGSDCYAYVQNPKKLDERSIPGKFIGFDSNSPAKLVYFPQQNTIRKFRCVKFIKNESPSSQAMKPELVISQPEQLGKPAPPMQSEEPKTEAVEILPESVDTSPPRMEGRTGGTLLQTRCRSRGTLLRPHHAMNHRR